MRQVMREREKQILEALEIHESAGDLALETGLPFRQVIHYQRLYGPAHLQLQRAEEDRKRVAQMRREDVEAAREEQLRPRRRLRPDQTIALIAAAREERWRR